MKIFSPDDVKNLSPDEPNPNLWTVVIPAAGKGARLGYSKPKILYPILGRTILDRLIDLLEPYCKKFVFVFSPTTASEVVPLVENRLLGRFNAPVIENSRGMADSISQALPFLSTPFTLIIWGDQAGIQSDTIRNVMKLQQSGSETAMTLPLARRETPYVHYATDASGRFTHVLERREGASMPSVGESDCGVFAFKTSALQEMFRREIHQGISLSAATKEWNFLPMLPHLDAGGESVRSFRLMSLEETIGVNDTYDDNRLEKYLIKFEKTVQSPQRADQEVPVKKEQGFVDTKESCLKVVMFSGGRGTGSLTEALLKYPDIELTLLVNAYDDGLSTGLLRRFIPGMLGPSDIRKNISRFVRRRSDRASQALHMLLEHRLPEKIETGVALALLKDFTDTETFKHPESEIFSARENLSLIQMRRVSRYLTAFLVYYESHAKKCPWFVFGDVSFGNLLFAGCYLANDRDFNRAIADFSRFADIPDRVLNVTKGENLVLVGMKQDGKFLHDEASIVGPQDASRIEEIFLVPEYLCPDKHPLGSYKRDNIRLLRSLEQLPVINPNAEKVLREADIIIYGPGTQYSSLFPSYLTSGVAEAIEANTKAEKVFIGNIARDYDILGEDATTLVRAFLWNMGRKVSGSVACTNFVSHFFFQKPETNASGETPYVPFNAKEFEYPMSKVRWIDWEGEKGKHLGSRTISELLLLVEGELQKRIRHISHTVSIIVPVLNEERTMKAVLKDLVHLRLRFPDMELEKEIIVVDGGSTDQSFEIAKQESSVRSYQLSGKRGRGAALRLGIEKAKGDIIIFFPSDGEYDVSDILRVVSPIARQEFSAVFGSRAFEHSRDLDGTLRHVYGNKGVLFVISKYGGMLLSVMTLLLYRRFISDPLTSIKGFNARIFRNMRFDRSGVDFDMELIAKIARSEQMILEVPVNYSARTVREGKKTTVWDGIDCFWTLLRFSFWKPRWMSASKKSDVTKPIRTIAS